LKFSLNRVGKIFLCVTLLQMFILAQTVSTDASPATVVRVEPHDNTAAVGETFTINITLTDVQNLFGLEVTLDWNASILQIVGEDVRLGVESHPDGVLHEPIFNQTTQEEGKYQIVATSTGHDTPSFNGSGNIVEITFKVIEAGSSQLDLETKLASKPPLGGVSSPIVHTTTDGLFGPETPQQPVWPYAVLLIVIGLVGTATATLMYRRRSKRV